MKKLYKFKVNNKMVYEITKNNMLFYRIEKTQNIYTLSIFNIKYQQFTPARYFKYLKDALNVALY